MLCQLATWTLFGLLLAATFGCDRAPAPRERTREAQVSPQAVPLAKEPAPPTNGEVDKAAQAQTARLAPPDSVTGAASNEPAPAPSEPQRLEDRTTDSLLDELLANADEGHSSVLLAQQLGERGMQTAEAIAPHIDLENQPRLNALCEVLALAGKTRRYHAELLGLYDPVAHEWFYEADSAARQASISKLLSASEWPRELSAAVVTTAPLPTLAWLTEQAAATGPDLAKVRRVARFWGQWSRQANERQYTRELGQVLAALLANAALQADPAALADLVRASGDCRSSDCLPAIITAITHDDPQVRKQAATALGRLGSSEALAALVSRLPSNSAAAPKPATEHDDAERDATVLADISAALGNWPDDSQSGAALFGLFKQTTDERVRREVLFSAGAAHWPQRTELLKAAFAAPEQGSLGVALLALSGGVPNELREPVLALLADVDAGQPALIDALGALADEQAVPYLVASLKKKGNTPLRLKAAFALEKIASPAAIQALVEVLQQELDPLLVEHLVGIAGNLKLEPAEPTLLALAEDTTAPMPIRVQAIWSLGAIDTSRSRKAIGKLSADPRALFGRADDPALAAGDAERIELAALFLAIARLRQGDPRAAADIEAQYEAGSATTQLSALLMLARIKRDHPVIATGLASSELAILLSAVRAAGAADPKKYHGSLVTLRDSAWLARLFDSSADTLNLRRDLLAAIEAGEVAK